MKDKEPTEELVVVDISRYKKIKNALKDSEVRYRSLFENMPIGIFRFSADGKILDANPALQKILGYAASAELERKNPGKNDKNLLKILSEFCAKIESQNEFRSFDLTWRKKDNTPLSIRVNARMVSAGANNVLFCEGTVEDISERKQAEEALARQNDALSKLNQFSIELSMLSSADNLEAFITKRIKEFTGAVAAIFSEYNPESRTTTPQHIEMEPRLLGKVVGLLSKQVERIHSVVSDEMYREITTEIIGIRKTLHEASFGAVSRPAGAAIQALLKVDRFIGVAYLIDGELYGTSLLAMRKGQPDLPKEILENFSFLAAVSLKRKQAESQREAALEALRESEEKFRSIFNNIVDLYYQTDMQGLITNLSPSCFVLSGWKPEELIGCQVLDFYTDRKQRKALLKKLLREDAVSDYEITLLHRDGKHIAVSVSSHLIRNEQGNPKYVEGIIRDISERKRAESQREAALEALRESEEKFRSIFNNI
ncbi:MAG: PAS domain S-box protein, partial [Candidatus Aminicenantes bacterium]|nr:PAS domain S-box protein [Candidatus Aminicenantes bacterium]